MTYERIPLEFEITRGDKQVMGLRNSLESSKQPKNDVVYELKELEKTQ